MFEKGQGQGGSLFFHFPDDSIDFSVQKMVQEHKGNGHDEAELGGDQSFGDSTGHHSGVTGAEHGDGLKCCDHAGNRPQQPEQRSRGCQHGQGWEKPLQRGGFSEQALFKAGFKNFLFSSGMGYEMYKHPALRS